VNRSYTIGDATNSDEYVPIKIPTINATENPLITSPPKIAIAKRTMSVVALVLIVLVIVLLRASLTLSFRSLLG